MEKENKIGDKTNIFETSEFNKFAKKVIADKKEQRMKEENQIITLKMKRWELDEINKEMTRLREMNELLQNKLNSWIVVGEKK